MSIIIRLISGCITFEPIDARAISGSFPFVTPPSLVGAYLHPPDARAIFLNDDWLLLLLLNRNRSNFG